MHLDMPDPILTYRMYSMVSIKGTLMQIWKSPYVCVHIKTIYPENFAFLTFTIHQLFTREVCKFLKNLANFYLIQLFLNVCKQTFHISRALISKSKGRFNMKSSTYYFHVKTKMLADFQICISVPVNDVDMSHNW